MLVSSIFNSLRASRLVIQLISIKFPTLKIYSTIHGCKKFFACFTPFFTRTVFELVKNGTTFEAASSSHVSNADCISTFSQSTCVLVAGANSKSRSNANAFHVSSNMKLSPEEVILFKVYPEFPRVFSTSKRI